MNDRMVLVNLVLTVRGVYGDQRDRETLGCGSPCSPAPLRFVTFYKLE